MGRPTLYSIELAEAICARIAAGENVSAICEGELMPHRDTLYEWKSKHKEFSDMYACARENWADAQFERIIEIAADGAQDYDTKGDVRTEHITRSRLHVDTLKWALAKVNKKYGERSTTDLTNSDGSLSAPDPALIAKELAAIYDRGRQKMLAAAPADATDAEFEEIIDDGSDLC